MQERNLESYRYTECGLDGVYVKGLETLVDDHGEEVLHIRNVNGLHKLIARAIVHRDAAMSSLDLRFLRTEMGFTQSQLATPIHCDAKTIARWEKDQIPVPEAVEVNIRVLAVEKLDLEGCSPIKDISVKRASSVNDIYEIDLGELETR